MNTRTWTIGLAALLIGGTVHAADKPASTPAMTPEMVAMQKKAMELGTPGAHHKMLEPTVGKWTAKASFWMKSGDKPMVSEGTSETTWILGGRFLKQDYKGTWEGQPFEGLGIIGYDNMRAEYQSLWLDSMMTGQMIATGTYDAAAKLFKFGGTFSCPMTGEKNRAYRAELKINSNDKHTYVSYDKTPEGKEFKSMEIVYTRAK